MRAKKFLEYLSHDNASTGTMALPLSITQQQDISQTTTTATATPQRPTKTCCFKPAAIGFLIGILCGFLVYAVACNNSTGSATTSDGTIIDLVDMKYYYEEKQVQVQQPTQIKQLDQQRFLQENNNSNVTSTNNATKTSNGSKSNITCPDSTENSSSLDVIPLAVQYILILILVLFSAGFSGLTLGLMGLDLSGLEIVMNSDDERNAKCARQIYPIRKTGNLLLCTLLLGNVAVNALLSILLADKAGGLIGFFASTFVIVIFGEILPQALCNRYALQIGSKCVPVVRVIMVILYPISKPIAFILDKCLGKELATTYSTTEMKKLLEIHVKEGRFDEETGVAMAGALNYKDIEVQDVMTPIEHTFMLSVDDKLSFNTIAKIFKTGYSRIPVYEISHNNIIGLLFVKDLIFIDPEDETPVRSFVQIFGRGTQVVWPDNTLGDVLREFKKGRSHMALVRQVVNDEDGEKDPHYEIKGIITLEDIIEEILGDEIVDETDEYVDGTHSKRVTRNFQMGISENNEAAAAHGGSNGGDSNVFDWGRLRLLDTKIVDETLSFDETKAVVAHLRTNYTDTVSLLSDKQLHRLVSETAVTYYDAPEIDQAIASQGGVVGAIPPSDKLLYEKGVSTDTCTLILAGKVTVLAGSDNFRSDVSSWSFLGTKALTNAPPYTPDFTAYVTSDTKCRCLQFKRDVYMKAVDVSTLEQQTQPRAAPTTVVPTTPKTDHQTTMEDSRNQPKKMKNFLSASPSIVTPSKKSDITAATSADERNNNSDSATNTDEGKRKSLRGQTKSRRDKLIASIGLSFKNKKEHEQQSDTISSADNDGIAFDDDNVIPPENIGDNKDINCEANNSSTSNNDNIRASRKRQKSIDYVESDAALLFDKSSATGSCDVVSVEDGNDVDHHE